MNEPLIEWFKEALGVTQDSCLVCDDYWETEDGFECACGAIQHVRSLAVSSGGAAGTPAETKEGG